MSAAWELLWDARQAYAGAVEARAQSRSDAPSEKALKTAQESLLAAEGSDWCWWLARNTVPPMTPNSMRCSASTSPEFTSRLPGCAVGSGQAHQAQAGARAANARQPVFSKPPSMDATLRTSSGWAPACILRSGVAARCTDAYFIYASCDTDLKTTGSACASIHFWKALCEMDDPEFRITIGGAEELSVVVKLERGRLAGFAVEMGRVCLLNPTSVASAAFRSHAGSFPCGVAKLT